MKCFRYALLLLLLAGCGLTVSAEYPAGYYNSLVGKNKGELKTAACKVIRSHTNLGYGDASWEAFKKTDIRMVDGTAYWWDMYSSELVAVSSGHGGLNIEHSVANSWWDGTKNDAYNDIHHLNPSNSTANSRKSNYPLGKVATVSWTNGVTTVGKPASSSAYGGATNVYEPCDEYKGDFARVFMYMFTCYEDMTWGTRFTWMYNEGEKYPMFRTWAVDLLLEWSRLDPVSEKEINRNEAVYAVQKNRNPFIDLPQLAEYIWGSKKTLPFTLDGEEEHEPELISPRQDAEYDLGTYQEGSSTRIAIPVQGRYLTNPLIVSVSGSNIFSIDKSSISVSDATEGTNLTVTYSASEIGTSTAIISIGGGGMQEPVSVTVRGTTVEKTQLTPLVALDPKPLRETSYRARWNAAPVTPDYYIVNRTYKVNGEMKTRKFMTTAPYYDFYDRDYSSDESYSVQYAVGSDVSAPSNIIEIKSGTVSTPEIAADAFEVDCRPGGVEITCGKASLLTITDVSGRALIRMQEAVSGNFIPLSKGIYILSSPTLRKPLKIYVP